MNGGLSPDMLPRNLAPGSAEGVNDSVTDSQSFLICAIIEIGPSRIIETAHKYSRRWGDQINV